MDNPVNLQVLIGTPVKDCLATCGYQHSEGNKVIIGGPMMGLRVTSPNMPIIKTTNCIIIEENAPARPQLPCIRCGDCAEVCPELLLPQQLLWFARTGNADQCREHRLFNCIECGCCAYVCPSRIPLVHYYRQAKAELALDDARARAAAAARRRSERKTERTRLAADARRQSRRPRAPDLQQGAGGQGATQQDARADKKAYVQAVLARTRARRNPNTTPDATRTSPDD